MIEEEIADLFNKFNNNLVINKIINFQFRAKKRPYIAVKVS